MFEYRSDAKLAVAQIVCALLVACVPIENEDMSGSTPPATSIDVPIETPPAPDEPNGSESSGVQGKPSPIQASRFLLASSFGPDSDSIDELINLGYANWVQTQLELSTQSILDRALPILDSGTPNASKTGVKNHIPISLFYEDAILGEDQLRSRAAYSLSQIFVVSSQEAGIYFDGVGVSSYIDILKEGAFGNFRDVLEEVTYSPVMGEFLTYRGNRKADPMTGAAPDENFAREIMQLFTIGLYELELDGTLKLDDRGFPIETYDNEDITELAKVFTGLSFDGVPFDQEPEGLFDKARSSRMVMFEEYHSQSSKSFLGHTIANTSSGSDSIDEALDILFNHPNTAPFISKQLIQRLTTSNPKPSYVRRVAQAFEAGEYQLLSGDAVGSGERGDLRAVWAAILLDPDFLDPLDEDQSTFGKVREPVLRWTHWARMANVPSVRLVDGDGIIDDLGISHERSDRLGQRPFSAPSVFNFYRPGYRAAGSSTADAGLVSPELQIANESSVVAYANFMLQFVFRDPGVENSNGAILGMVGDYSEEIALAHDAEALVERIDLLLTAGAMSDQTKNHIIRVVNSVSFDGAEDLERLRDRVQLAVQLTVVSPEFIVQQ